MKRFRTYCLYITFITLLFSPLWLKANPLRSIPPDHKMTGVPDFTLNLNKVDSLRILLFQTNSPRKIFLSAKDGQVLVFRGSVCIDTLSDSYIPVSFYRHKDFIIYQNGKKRIKGKNWIIKGDEIALTRIQVSGLPYRYYRGIIHLQPDKNSGDIQIINKTSLEDYVGSVVGSEMNFTENEALKAQAVISRTYALWNISKYGQSDYELTDHTMSQVYNGELITKPYYLDAALATSGEILTWSGKLILAAYSSTCGGITANNENVWKDSRPLPYLRSVNDHGACRQSPHFNWTFSISKDRLDRIFSRLSGQKITGIDSLKYSNHKRVTDFYLKVRNSSKPYDLTSNDVRLAIMKLFGQDSMESTLFKMKIEGQMCIFNGYGLGHGIGLCQWGSKGLADAGWTYKDILRFYYTGVNIVDYHQLSQTFLKLAN